jgi:CRP-like cAMP-binding protein
LRIEPFTYPRDVSKREVAERLKEVPVTRKGKKVRTLGPGSHFGEIALLKLVGRTSRSATVTARTLVRCFLLPGLRFAT